MSSREKGMEESSSSRKEWLAAVLLSTISCFMRASTCKSEREAPLLVCFPHRSQVSTSSESVIKASSHT